MSTASVSSYHFYKPKHLYDSFKKSDFIKFYKSDTISDDNIFGREKFNYVYDVPKSNKHVNDNWLPVQEIFTNKRPTNFKKNGFHLCHESDKIKRY